MADNEGMQRIEPSSPVYQEVARLYQIARQLRPSGLDRWNGELYARFDDKWGGLGRDGTMRLGRASDPAGAPATTGATSSRSFRHSAWIIPTHRDAVRSTGAEELTLSGRPDLQYDDERTRLGRSRS